MGCMAVHKLGVKWRDGRGDAPSTLEPLGEPAVPSGMARTAGVPCGIQAQLVLDGVLDMHHVHAGDM